MDDEPANNTPAQEGTNAGYVDPTNPPTNKLALSLLTDDISYAINNGNNKLTFPALKWITDPGKTQWTATHPNYPYYTNIEIDLDHINWKNVDYSNSPVSPNPFGVVGDARFDITPELLGWIIGRKKKWEEDHPGQTYDKRIIFENINGGDDLTNPVRLSNWENYDNSLYDSFNRIKINFTPFLNSLKFNNDTIILQNGTYVTKDVIKTDGTQEVQEGLEVVDEHGDVINPPAVTNSKKEIVFEKKLVRIKDENGNRIVNDVEMRDEPDDEQDGHEWNDENQDGVVDDDEIEPFEIGGEITVNVPPYVDWDFIYLGNNQVAECIPVGGFSYTSQMVTVLPQTKAFLIEIPKEQTESNYAIIKFILNEDTDQTYEYSNPTNYTYLMYDTTNWSATWAGFTHNDALDFRIMKNKNGSYINMIECFRNIPAKLSGKSVYFWVFNLNLKVFDLYKYINNN